MRTGPESSCSSSAARPDPAAAAGRRFPGDKPDEKWEKWHTIDGGGTAAREARLCVRLSDPRVQFAGPDKPRATSTTAPIGWIDMDVLVAGETPGATAAPG